MRQTCMETPIIEIIPTLQTLIVTPVNYEPHGAKITCELRQVRHEQLLRGWLLRELYLRCFV